MREPQPKAIHLKDYAPPAFRVDSVDLDVDLRDDHARVRAKLQVRRNAGSGPLVLDGEELELISVSLDGKRPQYEVAAQKLVVRDVPDGFTLETVSRALSVLHDKGVLGFLGQTQRQIVLLDRPKLAELDL